MQIVILGLSITSSWGNGHATTYRGLVRELVRRGHDVLFLERDMPWYAANRDLPVPPYGRTELYDSLSDLQNRFADEVRFADAVIVGSFVPEGIQAGEWVTQTAEGVRAFYDIDTPVTLERLEDGGLEYLSTELIPRYDLYLSFTGGPTLRHLRDRYGAARAEPLWCAVDPEVHYPQPCDTRWDLGYLGTYSEDRQPGLQRLLLEVAVVFREKRFAVAGPQYPSTVNWPPNVHRIHHVPPAEHRGFYNAQAFTLNLTRAPMVHTGWSPSVRLFEAAACGTAIISDWWSGLDLFFIPGREILLAHDTEDVLRILFDTKEAARVDLGQAARRRVLAAHTAAHRAAELEHYFTDIRAARHLAGADSAPEPAAFRLEQP